MTISLKVKQNIQLLQDLDPAHFSIEQDDLNLKKINKRSRLCNFFHWVIHLLTLTLVPRNRELDRITSNILKEIQDELENATDAEKNLAEKAIRNLKLVIKNNGGSQDAAVDKMLAALAKIQSLPAVQNLAKQHHKQENDFVEIESEGSIEELDQEKALANKAIQEDFVEAESSPKELSQENDLINEAVQADPVKVEDASTKENQANTPPITPNFQETRLRDLLQNLLNQNASVYESTTSITELLPQLEGSVPLSNDLLAILARASRMKTRISNFSPGLLTCLVHNSFENADFTYLSSILDEVSFNREQILAFIYGLKLYHDTHQADVPPKIIPPTQMGHLIHLFKSHIRGDALTTSFKEHLSEDEMKDFIKIFFELIISQTSSDNQKAHDNYIYAFSLKDEFGNQHTQLILKILCQIKNISLLAKIYKWQNTKDILIEAILKFNPPKADDPDDHFFQDFLKNLIGGYKEETASYSRSWEENSKAFDCEKHAKHIAQYVFAHECPKRQEILASQLPSPVIALNLEQIPTQAWKNIPDPTLLNVASNLSHQKPAPTEAALKAFAQGFNADRLYDLITKDRWYPNIWVSLLPLCEFNTQIQLISKALDSNPKHLLCELDKAQLNLKAWEEASKQNPAREYRNTWASDVSPKITAHIVNGQINNPKFLKDFFKSYFLKATDAKELENLKACAAHLKPEVFEFDKFDRSFFEHWILLFKTLRELPDQQQAQTLLIHSTLCLFNSPDFSGYSLIDRSIFYALTNEQMKLLPIQKYTKPEIRLLLACLTEQLDDQLLDTANSLYDNGGLSFFDFLKKADNLFLHKLLLWVLNRPSILPALGIWSLINSEVCAQDLLLREDIQDNADIQAHIRRLGLKVFQYDRRYW